MSTKLIAIGNKLMGDDGIALIVADKIKEKLKDMNIEVIIGETDFDFCLDFINKDDFIIILDSTHFNIKKGNITLLPLDSLNQSKNFFFPHSLSLIHYLLIYNIKGIFIGIEAENIDFTNRLSSTLSKNLDNICNNVLKVIKDFKADI
ncbi:hydrogenase maturation protease [Caloramator quimbayensis]|uniref:Hydrogenase maturation protease n=1 Tax=Caloramator quimbayensis TaxID=1147123 RepID=A0A1T4WSW7_9CLOT|nr:hydrogenase maturation protease [Caloramator quimbayensis]SKA80217.1 hydrogenase maturation protease [Caloramator quimbayensis]